MSDRRFSNSSPRRFPFPRALAATLLPALALTGGASSALAQAPAQDQEPIEEIFVTGSRLATTGLDTASPVTVISSDEIAFTNLSSTGELLRELPLSPPRRCGA
jgi:iron complex outermembrane receptor protein